ncbi:hypothetical protein [Shewanella algae]|uniref:hypothetical protein n=1 Tax=Shewanella algae TaxID=38313 RepID=UPI000F42959F|nr:hypothetical protein [Shewanella algae]AYV12973.1 hypothetical protein EEY24_08780 [Shewanella algae]
MTTTTFKLTKIGAMMAADSRVTFQSAGVTVSCKDYDGYRKVIDVDGVLYGFAGANSMFHLFLVHELGAKFGMTDVEFLDQLADSGKQNSQEFVIIRYSGELRTFGYLGGEVFDSTSEPLKCSFYGIGSGAKTRVYNKHKNGASPMTPISKIIQMNAKTVKKFSSSAAIMDLVHACHSAGSDYGTGGKINMTTTQSSMEVVREQARLLETISGHAAAYNAVAVCNFDASVEKSKLEKKGVKPSTKQQDVPSLEQLRVREQLAIEILTFNAGGRDLQRS